MEELIMTADMVLENLKKLIGSEFDADEIICSFEDFEEGGETQVYLGDSGNDGYDYIAYIDVEDSTQFLISTEKEVDENGDMIETITDVWMY